MDHQSSDTFLSHAKRTGAKTTYVTAALGCSLPNIRGKGCPTFILAVFANRWFLLIAES
jgi:hypothetical protein